MDKVFYKQTLDHILKYFYIDKISQYFRIYAGKIRRPRPAPTFVYGVTLKLVLLPFQKKYIYAVNTSYYVWEP